MLDDLKFSKFSVNLHFWVNCSFKISKISVLYIFSSLCTFTSTLNPLFALLGIGCSLLLMYMFCTDFWVIAAIYTAWLIHDWNTPKQGNLSFFSPRLKHTIHDSICLEMKEACCDCVCICILS